MIATVQHGQTLFDIALRECGDIESVFSIARRNGLSVTDDLEQGRVIEIAPEDVMDRRVAERYATAWIDPATALSEVDLALAPGGIGYMGIEIDFKIS
jgi:hypothetical protein